MLQFGPLKHFKSDNSNSLDATISKNYDGKAITNIYAHTDRKNIIPSKYLPVIIEKKKIFKKHF